MDFDEFEAQGGKTVVSKSSSCSRISNNATLANSDSDLNLAALTEDYDDWDIWAEYMHCGMAGRKSRDYYGFHLPHRTPNDYED
jgi:hypothetical protein